MDLCFIEVVEEFRQGRSFKGLDHGSGGKGEFRSNFRSSGLNGSGSGFHLGQSKGGNGFGHVNNSNPKLAQFWSNPIPITNSNFEQQGRKNTTQGNNY